MKKLKSIIAITIVFVMVVCLTACGDSPTSVTEKFLNAVKANNTEEISKYYAGDSENILNNSETSTSKNESLQKIMKEQLYPKMLEFDFTVSNEQIDGDSATVDVAFKTYDIGKAMAEFAKEYLKQGMSLKLKKTSDDEINKAAETIMKDQISKLTEKTYEKTAKLNLVKKDGNWVVDKLDNNTDALDAMSGGLYTFAKNLSNSDDK